MIKKTFSKLKNVLPISVGFLFIYYSYINTTLDEREYIINSIIKADYKYVFISLFFGLLSHLSRAYRWRYMLSPIGYNIKFQNSFMSIMAGYITNLGIPRSGELIRATILYTYEKVDFNKGLGTIITERIIDVIVLLICILIGISFYPNLWFENYVFDLKKIMLYFILIISVILLVYLVIKKMNITHKIISFLSGLKKGIMSLFIMPKKEKFLLHTFFIWLMYFLMIYIVKFSLPETHSLDFKPIFIAFVSGVIAFSTTNGGIGIYPLVIASVLNQYNVNYESALAFGWIVWTTQTVLFIFIGSLSFVLLPIINKNKLFNAKNSN
tara:strand:- start:3446 stop:4420 length:975 start_codon:yes stop_codon:yes gene_type:complete